MQVSMGPWTLQWSVICQAGKWTFCWHRHGNPKFFKHRVIFPEQHCSKLSFSSFFLKTAIPNRGICSCLLSFPFFSRCFDAQITGSNGSFNLLWNLEPGMVSIYLIFYVLHPRWVCFCGWAPCVPHIPSPFIGEACFYIFVPPSVPEASSRLATTFFLFEPGITVHLPVGTRLSCYLQSNERKTWTLWGTFPSKEDNTSIPFIRRKKRVRAVFHFGSKPCKCGRYKEDDFQGEYFSVSAQAVVKQLRSFTTVLSLVGWSGSRTLQKIYLQSPKEPE